MARRNRKIALLAAMVALLVPALVFGWFSEPRDMLYNGLQRFKQAVTFDGAATFNGGVTNTGTMTQTGAQTITGDLTVNNVATGNNAATRNTIDGLFKLELKTLGGVLANGTTETTLYVDDTPTGEWAEVDAGTAVLVTADTSIYKVGANSLKVAFTAAAVAGDGVTRTITNDDLEADEYIGFWIYSTDVLTAGDLTLVLTDNGGARTFNVPAVATANAWTWVEVDITALTGGTGDVVSAVKILLSTAGAAAHGAMSFYIDGMYKWDAADEKALGRNLVMDGCLSVLGMTNANTGVHTFLALVENTDYFISYRAAGDVLVPITDQSLISAVALLAYR